MTHLLHMIVIRGYTNNTISVMQFWFSYRAQRGFQHPSCERFSLFPSQTGSWLTVHRVWKLVFPWTRVVLSRMHNYGHRHLLDMQKPVKLSRIVFSLEFGRVDFSWSLRGRSSINMNLLRNSNFHFYWR